MCFTLQFLFTCGEYLHIQDLADIFASLSAHSFALWLGCWYCFYGSTCLFRLFVALPRLVLFMHLCPVSSAHSRYGIIAIAKSTVRSWWHGEHQPPLAQHLLEHHPTINFTQVQTGCFTVLTHNIYFTLWRCAALVSVCLGVLSLYCNVLAGAINFLHGIYTTILFTMHYWVTGHP